MIAPSLPGIVPPRRFRIVLCFLCVYLCSSVANLPGEVRAAETASDPDEAVLKAAGIATDGPNLAAYIKQRTVTVADENRIKALVRRLGDDAFKVRENASRQLVMLGSRARPFLQTALKDPDPEIARRAQDCLERIAKGTSATTMCAAVRMLARRKPPSAAAALLDYLPSAEEERVAETVRQVLPMLAVRDGKAEPALVEALSEKSPLKRAAAGAALAHALGALTQPRSPDVMPKVRKLLRDPDVQVRLRVGLALADSREKEALPVLIRLLDELPWRDTDPIMDLLERLAGESMPEVVYGPNADAHRKYREAWQTWWKEHQATIEPAHLERALRPRGYTLVVLLDQGVIQDLDAANKIRWKFENVTMTLDVQLLPGEQRVLLAEHQANRVSERNLKGEVVWQKLVAEPLMAQRLANGNTFIATRTQLLEVDKNGKEVFSYSRPDGGNFMRAVKLRDGDIACIVQMGGVLSHYVRLTPSGKDFKEKSWGVQVRTSGGRIDVLPNGHVLIPEKDNNRVVEYDADGHNVWEAAINQPIVAMRLANGNTLVTSYGENRAVEVDRNGKEVWQFKADTRVTRALRR
ncbi:MAG TPA: HEAT repeat domain-containing protein [Gemmataceae bacterium]|nr:HEAT repeat domain-containing protein [Gemmataceae bacterium]